MVRPKRLPKISLLKRRRDYLARELASNETGYAIAWDTAELAALNWAIELIEGQGLSDEQISSSGV